MNWIKDSSGGVRIREVDESVPEEEAGEGGGGADAGE